jgi:hypothetical protein
MINRAAYLSILLVAVNATAQTSEQNINVTIKPSQTVEQRVADSIKEKQLREAAEEKLAAERSAHIAASSPRALLSAAQTVYVRSDTAYFDSIQLQNELLKNKDFQAWEMAILDWRKGDVADIIIEVDRPLFTFTFTYKITDRANGILLSSGSITAFDGNIAAPMLSSRIMKDIKKARDVTSKK